MDDSLKKKIWLGVVAALILALLTGLGHYFNQSRTKESALVKVTTRAELAEAACLTITAKLAISEQSRRKSEKKIEKLSLALNPLTGGAQLDSLGNPIFNHSLEEDNSDEEIVTLLTFEQTRAETAERELKLTKDRLEEFEKKTSVPVGPGPWEFGLYYSAPNSALTDYAGAATYWLELAWHFEIAGLDVGARVQEGTKISAPVSGSQTKVGASFRP